MTNRKRTAEEAQLDSIPKEGPSRERLGRQMQGDGHDGTAHTIDSDEEDVVVDKKYEVLQDDDIEGQEDDTIEKYDDVKITPFNLKEEQEEGEFATDGSFIWKKSKEIKDAWLDNVDWVKVKEIKEAEKDKQDAQDKAEDEAMAAYNEEETYKKMVALMKPGETVAKTIRRLGGASGGPGQQKIVQQKQRKIAQKLKKGQKLTEDEESFQKSRKEMEVMSGLADLILSRSGNMEIYDETFEKINFILKEKEENKMTEDDELDMFARDLDEEKKEDGASKQSTNDPTSEEKKSAIDISDEVSWEFRWEQSDSAEIHGPHTSTEMLKVNFHRI